MDIGEKEIKKVSIMLLIVIIGVLSYFTIKPVLYAVITGLVLAYIFMPIFKKIDSAIGNKTISAIIVLIIALLIILLPIWFITPLVIQQIFEIYRVSQSLDVTSVVKVLFPTSSDQFTSQLVLASSSFIGQISSSILNSLIALFIDVPKILINIFLSAFVFFYSLKDSERLKEFVRGLSPIVKSKEKIIIDQFKNITDSIVYGQIIIGIIQGILAGLGFLVVGVPNALVLTLLATFLSIIPLLGPYLVWIPVAIYLFVSGKTNIAIIYLLYNLILVSSMDNIIRSHLVSRKTNLSPAVVLIGMLGGLVVFGLIGLLLGPLILAYFITLLKSYKEKNLYSLFSEEDEKK